VPLAVKAAKRPSGISRFGRVALCQPLQIGLVVGVIGVKGDEGVVGQALHHITYAANIVN